MKRNYTKTTIILSIAIIILGIYMYKQYVSPLYINNEQQSIQIDLAKESSVTLKKNKNQDEIFAIEIEILGKSSSNLNILSKDSVGKIFKEIKLKKGNIDFIYQNEWYSNTCILEFSSEQVMKGKLKINYRFLELH